VSSSQKQENEVVLGLLLEELQDENRATKTNGINM
jgi:hypothetical protein